MDKKTQVENLKSAKLLVDDVAKCMTYSTNIVPWHLQLAKFEIETVICLLEFELQNNDNNDSKDNSQ